LIGIVTFRIRFLIKVNRVQRYRHNASFAGEVLCVVGEDVSELGVDDVLDDHFGFVPFFLEHLAGDLGHFIQDLREPDEHFLQDVVRERFHIYEHLVQRFERRLLEFLQLRDDQVQETIE
jgi:hypothetical protein